MSITKAQNAVPEEVEYSVESCDKEENQSEDCVQLKITDTSSGEVVSSTRIVLLAD